MQGLSKDAVLIAIGVALCIAASQLWKRASVGVKAWIAKRKAAAVTQEEKFIALEERVIALEKGGATPKAGTLGG